MAVDAGSIEGVLAERFKIDPPPVLIGCASAGAPVVFSRLRSPAPRPGRSLSVPAEDSYAFQVPLALPFYSGLWISGKRVVHSSVSLGDAFLFDLSANPTVGLDAKFDSVRLYMPKATLDAISRENGLPRVGGLKAQTFGGRDPVLYGLAQALAGAMEGFGGGAALFADSVSLAFHSHIVRAYGGEIVPSSPPQGGLSSWRLRRVQDFIDARLGEDMSMSELAAECRLSPRYFAKAFKRSTGVPPHRWLTMRRLARAKNLLVATDLTLAEIALACGFTDQSYFTRIFARHEASSPGRWRRERKV
jgi:AraC family transcriptional regulator